MPNDARPQAPTRWLWLAALCLLALALRGGYLWWWSDLTGAAWIDPDGYLGNGQRLIGRDGQWRWSLEAVRYSGPYFKAPLYPLFLSFVGRFTPFAYDWSVALVEMLLSVSLVPLVFFLGRLCHSTRAGWIAAALQAFELQHIQLVTVFRQEEVYIPAATLALLCLSTAVARPSAVSRFFVAGLLMGVAALARSMPLLFVGPAAVATLAFLGWRRTGASRAGAYVAGFLLIVLPYSLMLSAQAGRAIAIENIGTYAFSLAHPELRSNPPSFSHAARMTLAGLTPEAVSTVVRGVLRPSGGRTLQTMHPVANRQQATLVTLAVRVGEDLLVAVVLLLAPLGFAFATGRRVAWILALWIVVNLIGVGLAGYSGPRFRTPFMPALLVLASAALAGSWARTGRAVRATGLVVSALAVWIVATALPSSLAARVDHGIAPWRYESGSRSTELSGHAGLTVYPVDGIVRLLVQPADAARGGAAAFSFDDGSSRPVPLTERQVEVEQRVHPARRWAFVEIRASQPVTVKTR